MKDKAEDRKADKAADKALKSEARKDEPSKEAALADWLGGESGPIYQRLVRMVCWKVQVGEWPPGYKLPTVRELAEELDISYGTVKHAYDELEILGIVQMTQGRGTFVRGDEEKRDLQGKKDRAMTAIDLLLQELEALEFSPKEIRIFLDLKLRQREEMSKNVRIGVVDCNPEALSIIDAQLSALPGIDVYRFLLQDVLATPYRLDDRLDLILTTSNHFSDIQDIVPDRGKLMFMVLSPSQNTIMDLAKIAGEKRVGILCSSRKFAYIIEGFCRRFCTLAQAPEICLLGNGEETLGFPAKCDELIMAPDYLKFCSEEEKSALTLYLETGKRIIAFDYQIDDGSFFYLRDRIQHIHRSRE